MKTVTMVIEFQHVPDELSEKELEQHVSASLEFMDGSKMGFQVMETIEAPYGAQRPGGVFIKEVKK